MKLAFVSASLSRKSGGLFEANRRVAQELCKLGESVEAFGLFDDQSTVDQADWLPVAARFANRVGPKQIGYSPALARMLDAYSPDVLHSHGLWLGTSALARSWGKKTGRPVIVHPHGMLDPWAVKNSAWKKRLAGWLFENSNLRRAACIRALCESEAQSIRQFGLTNPIAIIPNGIDLPFASACDLDRAMGLGVQGSLEGSSGVPQAGSNAVPGTRNLLYLGRIHPKKGLVNLLRAWGELEARSRRSSPQRHVGTESWTLSIAGWDEGGHEKQLKQLATDLEIRWCDVRDGGVRPQGATVMFLGPQFKDAKSRCYQNCDAFVLPSFSEGLPMVVLEAWAYGKPVLMTPQCNLPEGFQSESAIRIETTVESIVEGLCCMRATTREDRERIGMRGKELVRQKFTWSEVAKQVRDVSIWVTQGGIPPDCLRLDG